MIKDVKIKNLDIKKDERGWFTEILRGDEVGNTKLGQFYVTTANQGQTKGKHYHNRKYEWFCVVKGSALLTLIDTRTNEEQTIEMGDKNMVTVEIPPKVWHAISNTGETEMFLIAHISEPYNPSDPDTIQEER